MVVVDAVLQSSPMNSMDILLAYQFVKNWDPDKCLTKSNLDEMHEKLLYVDDE
jgi:hypothetical protein